VADGAQRQPEIERQPQRGDGKDDHEQYSLGAQDGREHLLVTDLAEPEPVGVEADQRRADKEGQKGECDDEGAKRSSRHDDTL
jgi:hypothetical protein